MKPAVTPRHSSRRRAHGRSAAVTIVALVSLLVISFGAAAVLRTVVPRYHVTYQTAGWQEARLAAEAGVDIAIERLNKNAATVTSSSADWVGWKQNSTTAATGSMLAKGSATAVSGLTASGNALTATAPIYLDNVDVSPAVGTAAAVDVELTALYPNPDASMTNPWIRIRSMGTAALPGPPRAAADRMDTALRRLSLRSPMRSRLAAYDVLTPTTVPFPNASRIVEVIARPVGLFKKAIVTDQGLTLGNSSGWQVNSYDSSDPNKSGTGGVFPGDSSPKIQQNGDIASNKAPATPTTYGPLISANGATVLGNVSTNGGDNPATPAVFENVSGAGGIDPSRITSDFYDPLSAVTVPTPATYRLKPAYTAGAAFPASGSNTTEYYYRVYSNEPALGPLTVSGTGRITIFIDGNWDIGSGSSAVVQIPPGVQATIYVKGNVDFGNGAVNTNSSSSKKAGNLVIYGAPDPNVDGTLPARTLSASGNPEIAAAFYGPSYGVTLSGNVEWYGAIAANSFSINGGGNGGFHYDEALGATGSIRKFEIVSYFENSRQ